MQIRAVRWRKVTAGPQVEDGFVRIASELYDAILLADFSKRELLVLLAIVRKTYGFNKTADDMTNTQIAKLVDLTPQHVSETVLALEARGIISAAPGKFGKVIGVQKNYRKWADLAPAKLTKKNSPKSGLASRIGSPESGLQSRNGCPETGLNESQIGTKAVPNRDGTSPETGHTIDNPNRQLQKTTPIDIGSGPPGPQPAAAKTGGEKEAPTAATWRAYSDAYQDRYGVAPPRNAKASGMLKQLLARIGAEEAPEVARWYLGSNDRWYVQKGHAIDYLLNDAEKLRTEWATRRRITATAANQADRTQANGQVWAKLIREAEEAQRG